MVFAVRFLGQNVGRANQSVNRDPDSGIDLEPDINMEREFDVVR